MDRGDYLLLGLAGGFGLLLWRVYRFTPEGRFERKPFKAPAVPTQAASPFVQIRKFKPVAPDMALPVVPEVPTQPSAPDPNV